MGYDKGKVDAGIEQFKRWWPRRNQKPNQPNYPAGDTATGDTGGFTATGDDPPTSPGDR